MNSSARGSRSRSRNGDGSMALKSCRSSATRTSITRHSVGSMSPADERARDIDPPETNSIRHNNRFDLPGVLTGIAIGFLMPANLLLTDYRTVAVIGDTLFGDLHGAQWTRRRCALAGGRDHFS